MTKQPRVFISYAHTENDFVARLRADLEARGADVWLDAKNIFVGDSISDIAERALNSADFVCLVLSTNSVTRPWVQREYRAALTLQLSNAGISPRILPLLIDDIQIPALLMDIRYADFRSNYASAFEELCTGIGLTPTVAPFLGILDALGSCTGSRHGRFVEAIAEQDVLLLSRTCHTIGPC